MIKHCKRCDEDKDVSLFYERKGTKDGRSNYCIECQKAYNTAYAKAHRAQCNAYAREWRARNPESARESNRKSYRKRVAKRNVLQEEV